MIAIFSNQNQALTLCDKIHTWLGKNCPNYNAERWQAPMKHPTKDKWGVKLPIESMKDVYSSAKEIRPFIKTLTDIADKIIDKPPPDWNSEVVI